MRLLSALLTAIFFLPAYASAAWQPELRIGLSTLASTALKFSLPTTVFDGSTPLAMLGADRPIEISIEEGKLAINGLILNASTIDIRPRQAPQLNDLTVELDGKKYFGGVRLILKGDRISVINLASIEQYLRGVVPVEMPASWASEALKAQSVAARTFAMKNRKRHESDGFDVCSTVHCQMYGGVEVSTSNSDAALEATSGQVLMSGGGLINAAFHTDSGGWTESASAVWGSDLPYLRAVEDYELKTQPWTLKVSLEEFGRKLAAAGFDVGRVKEIKLSELKVGSAASDRTASGRVRALTAVGDERTIEVSGEDMRRIFGLNSTLFDVKVVGKEVELAGYGRGHGVGMSQYGAKAYAERGRTFEEILKHYYLGAELKKAY